MARVNVNPNRMELSRLKKRLAVAIRGHKLLKDKQDALIKAFLEKARAVKAAREKVESELVSCYQSFLMARAQTLPAMLEQALMISGSTCTLDVKTRNVMSVIVPEYEVHQEGSTFNYGMATTPASLDVALEDFSRVIPSLLQLAADEKAVALMSTEIERTRRRVNALEHVMIPNYTETIKYISMKLDEQARSTTSQLMKVKEIVSKH
ncbi:MAG: V-type ATP synthase subunit D [Pyramidobacter sp.]|nr:V-type ATP synthase subunit D [Pyramidobacter sp.]MBP3752741.1 V-type ATP synthase subunit D [Pyramidobacter sp.]MBP3835571.1 V-type ATP synthase subunit D [Pyramidobacter sp.]MBP3848825.1 V-type ATP synthase subunit D [Pyramidobacter sp.]MBQ4490976.1 V-type ATP synthase subunit D [Pyramidobacter sp.]